MFELNTKNYSEINKLLHDKNWLTKDKKVISIDKIDHGNMNFTAYLTLSDKKKYIIKQGRSWVEKYPDISAPIGRTSNEHWYFNLINNNDLLNDFSPNIEFFDKENQILILEDLNTSKSKVIDGIELYNRKTDHSNIFEKAITYLTNLHTIKKSQNSSLIKNNIAMRELNGFHIFSFPFSSDGYAFINENFKERSVLLEELKKSSALDSATKKCYQLYLSNNSDYLLHGDFYPGSWLLRDKKLFVIDPEFCFFGLREFDLGVIIAHSFFLDLNFDLDSNIFSQYITLHNDIDQKLVYKIAGIEILRRIFGVAQLPLDLDAKRCQQLMHRALELVSH